MVNLLQDFLILAGDGNIMTKSKAYTKIKRGFVE